MLPVMASKKSAPSLVFYRGDNPGDRRRISTGDARWDSYIFVADNVRAATMYGSRVERITLHSDARVLREGTREFVRIAGKWRRGESLLDFATRAADAADIAGYDAVRFVRQSDVGTPILNPRAIRSREYVDAPRENSRHRTRRR